MPTGKVYPAIYATPFKIESALRAVDQDQETGGLSKNGNSSKQSCRLPGRDGSNYPGTPLSVSHVSPLCTRPVANSKTTRSDRPSRVNSRDRPPVKMQVRSGKEEPSVAESSQTGPRSVSTPVGELSAPPSADQPKLLPTPAQAKSARGVVGKRARRYNRVWCYPGRGTPSAPRTGRTPPVLLLFLLPSDNVQHDLQHGSLITFPKKKKTSETKGNPCTKSTSIPCQLSVSFLFSTKVIRVSDTLISLYSRVEVDGYRDHRA